MPKIRIIETSIKTYDPAEQDLSFYRGEDALNVDKIAILDKTSLESASISMIDIDAATVDGLELEEHTVTVVIIEDDGTEREPSEENVKRDYDIFPEEDEEDEEDDV
jgi:hypothetical protein